MTSSMGLATIGSTKRPLNPEDGRRHSHSHALVTAMEAISRDKLVMIATLWLLLLVIVALLGPILGPYDPAKQNIRLNTYFSERFDTVLSWFCFNFAGCFDERNPC